MLLKDILLQSGYDVSKYSEQILSINFHTHCTAENSNSWENTIKIVNDKKQTLAHLNGNDDEEFAYLEIYIIDDDGMIDYVQLYNEFGECIDIC